MENRLVHMINPPEKHMIIEMIFRRENISRITIKQKESIGRKAAAAAKEEFIRHCRVKNLKGCTITYYEENLKYFFEALPDVRCVDEIKADSVETYINRMIDRGNHVSAMNARLRAVFVFLRYCFEKEYMPAFPLALISEDECLKEPYPDRIRTRKPRRSAKNAAGHQ